MLAELERHQHLRFTTTLFHLAAFKFTRLHYYWYWGQTETHTQLEILKLFLFERHKEWGFSSCAWSEKVERLFVIQ